MKFFLTFVNSMDDSRRNTSPGIFVLVLMIVFFSFFQREKDKDTRIASSLVSNAISSGLQAIPALSTSIRITDIYWISTFKVKVPCQDCISYKEFIYHNLLSSYYNSSQHKLRLNTPATGFSLPQKVPGQCKEDDNNIPPEI